jgi:hypothetical protein
MHTPGPPYVRVDAFWKWECVECKTVHKIDWQPKPGVDPLRCKICGSTWTASPSPDLQGELVAACQALFAADHHDHFATRMSDSELAAIERIRAVLAKVPENTKTPTN